jgi:2-dehydropantoate 2-reductase
MKILVVGTGVIGTIYGWALAESGNEVVHYVREEKIGAFKDGIKIKMLDERKGHKKIASSLIIPHAYVPTTSLTTLAWPSCQSITTSSRLFSVNCLRSSRRRSSLS